MLNRGIARISTVIFIIGFLTFAKVWQPVYEPYGLSLTSVVVGLPIFVVGSAMIIGFIDFHYNFQKYEQVYASEKVGWDYIQVSKDIKEIKQTLVEQCRQNDRDE